MIQASALSIERLFALGVFEPAKIQRIYSWGERECGALIDDLERAFRSAGLDPDPSVDTGEHDPSIAETAVVGPDEPRDALRRPILTLQQRSNATKDYFLGQMLLMPRTDGASYYIFDGQQRLTSLTVLLCVLRDLMGDSAWLPLQEMLRTPDRRLPRLTAPTPGGVLSRMVGELRGTELARPYAKRSSADGLLWQASNIFKERCAIWSDAKRRAFVTYLREHVVVVATMISDRGLAEAAYQTTNTRGRPLGSDEVIKGAIVELVGRQSLGLADDLAQVWEQTRRAIGPRFSDFLEASVFCENYGVDHRGYAAWLIEAIEHGGAAKASVWVRDRLPQYQAAWNVVRAHHREDPSTGANIHFRRLSFLGWSHWVPVAMRIVMRDSRAPVRFQQSLHNLERWCFVVNLIGLSDARIAEACGIAIAQIDDGLDPFKLRPRQDQRFNGALYLPRPYKNRARANLVAPIEDEERLGAHVRWLETLYWSEELPHAPTHETNVEHVLPKSPIGDWTVSFPPEVIAIKTDLIGNFCLLPKDVNRKIGNAQFSEKRSAYAALPEIYRSAREVSEFESWTPESVDRRTQALASKAIDALGLGVPGGG